MTYGCCRSHPHELMDEFCELYTTIAKLLNENTRLKAQANPPGITVVHVYRLEDGTTQVRAKRTEDFDLVIDMLEEGLRAMTDGEKVNVS